MADSRRLRGNLWRLPSIQKDLARCARQETFLLDGIVNHSPFDCSSGVLLLGAGLGGGGGGGRGSWVAKLRLLLFFFVIGEALNVQWGRERGRWEVELGFSIDPVPREFRRLLLLLHLFSMNSGTLRRQEERDQVLH